MTNSSREEEVSPRQRPLLRSTYKIRGLKGVAQLPLQDVAADAGVSKALLLYYFKTKEGLILATLEWVLERVATRIRSEIAPVELAEAKVERMIDTIFIRPDLNRHFYLVYCDLLGQAARSDAFSALATTFHDGVNQMYADVVSMGIREGVFPPRDPEIAAIGVRALIDGTFLQWLLEQDWEGSHARYRELCKQSVLAYLRTT
jgi:TetR/AcrR family transcriptional regulator, fatty acid metabolism regulator protein